MRQQSKEVGDMIGYYVIPTNSDILEFTGRGCKAAALKTAKEIYVNGDTGVFIKRFDDSNYSDGYFADQETIYISSLFN